MSFLLDPLESGIDSLLDPLTATAAATSANEVVPVETSTTNSVAAPTSTSKTSKSSRSSHTSTSSESTSTSSARAKSTSSSSSDTSSTQTTTTDSSTSSSSTSTSISTSTTSSSSSPSSSTTPPPAPSAQPTLSPAQSTATSTPSSSSSSGPGISTAGIVVACIIAFALLISIIFLVIRFCPPVRKRIDAWYEKRREERTWRAAIDGVAAEKGYGGGSLSSAGGSSMDHNRPFSFFAAGKDAQAHSYHDQPSTRDLNMMNQPPSYVSPTNAPAEVYTPASARPCNDTLNAQGTGLGLGRVSLLRNTSLLRKAGFDAPPPPPSQVPRQLQLPQHLSSAPTQNRTSQAQIGRILKPTTSQIRRKPLPVDPPGVNMNMQNNMPSVREQQQRQRQQSMSYGIDPGLMPLPPLSAGHSRGHGRSDSLPKLQIQIPGQANGSVSELGAGEWDGRRVSHQSQIGVAVTGSPMGAVHPGRRSR